MLRFKSFLFCSELCYTGAMPVESISGRGATRNAVPTRFNLPERLVEGDWLDEVEALDGVPQRRTTVTVERPKSILTRNSSPDIGFDRSVNPYRGCEHGCIYCFARPTHAYHDLSPGVDFESRLFAKPDAAKLLHAALSRPGYDVRAHRARHQHRPYQPIEGGGASPARSSSCCRDPPPLHHHDQVRPRAARPRPDRPGRARGAGGGGHVGHLARSRDQPHAGAARARPARKRIEAIRSSTRPACRPCSRSRRSFRRSPIMSWNDRRGRRGGRRAGGLLPARPPAARGRAAVPRLARRALSRPRRQGDGDHPLDARRQGQRPELLHPHAGGRAEPGPTSSAPASPRMKLRRDLFQPQGGARHRGG
jgi:hypothetical protein